jgi:hypothetical protein
MRKTLVCGMFFLLLVGVATLGADEGPLSSELSWGLAPVLSLKGVVSVAGAEYAAVEVGGVALLQNGFPAVEVSFGLNLDRSGGLLNWRVRLSQVGLVCYLNVPSDAETLSMVEELTAEDPSLHGASLHDAAREKLARGLLYVKGTYVDSYRRSGFYWHELPMANVGGGLLAPLWFLLPNLWCDVGASFGFSLDRSYTEFDVLLQLGVSWIIPAF